ncbi:hypothetical protein [Frigoribacterium sp. PvP032]|nr:hypothetical protein [Frigoribacterium sp. PvP032]MBP1191106.1 hypothetical protein [Frigoribacterium sp. PvP032]
MASCAPRAAAASVDRTSASGARTLGSVVRRAGTVWSRRTVHFGAVSPRS